MRGFGFASYIECTAWGEGEEGAVTLEKDGTLTVAIGTQSTGQGHETAYAQVVSEQFDLPLERIRVIQGDTRVIPTGNGTGGSRSIPIGAVMVGRASTKLAASVKELAADKLEAAVADLEIADGKVRIAGTDRAIDLAEVAALAAGDGRETESGRGIRAAERDLSRTARTPAKSRSTRTPESSIFSLHVVDDFGFTLNPLLLAGQVHGGIAQGAGQALTEKAVFDENGQLVTASFMDYGMPRADDFPSFSFETRNVPSNTNPDGPEGRRRSGVDRIDAGGDERHRRRAVAFIQDRPHRHAGDAVRRLLRDPIGGGPDRRLAASSRDSDVRNSRRPRSSKYRSAPADAQCLTVPAETPELI